MKRKKRKELEEAIRLNTYTSRDIFDITKSLYKASFLRFLIFTVILIVSLINAKKISKLAIITADTVFSHEVYFSPTAYYFTSIGILVAIEMIMGLFILYKNKTLIEGEFKLYIKSFKVYDLLVFILEILVSINFIIMFIITPVTIEGSSMNNTFKSEDKVMIWHFMYNPNNEDVVVLDANKYNNKEEGLYEQEFYIKRIAAKEADVLTIAKDPYGSYYYLLCNGTPLECKIDEREWKNITGLEAKLTSSYVIPKDKILLLGDNRTNSYDGRSFGLVDKDDILGKVIFRYYPFNKIGYPDKNILENR